VPAPRDPQPLGASLEGLICSYDWPCQEALTVMDCESKGDPRAYNDGNHGLFQVSAVHGWRVDWNLEALFDPAVNTRVAHDIWKEQGWGPWACQP